MEALTSLNSTERSHALWGLWQGTIDPAAKTIDLTPLRIADFHLNALPFLEPPPLLNLTLESLEFNGDFIEADIGLRHPFLGLTEFTGFDVCGVFISNGSVSGFSDAGIVMAGQGDTRLVNPDGITRWWNPAEFPHGKTMFGYKEGLLGTPDSTADYNSTLNPYKYFCDALGPNDPLSTVPLAKRGMFSPGQKNIRHYTLHLGAGLIFNYAVDASWEFPQGSKPWIAPDDFSPSANRPEAWRADVTEVSNTLWNDGSSGGGSLSLSIDVYDWFNPELNTMTVESPNNFDPVGPIGPSGGGVGYSTFEVDITNATPQQQDSIDLLITVNCEEEGYGGFLPGKTVAAYFLHTATVGENNCANFSVTGAIPPTAAAGTKYIGFTVQGINFQDGPNLAVDIVDGPTVLASGESVMWVNSTTITCDLDFCAVKQGGHDLRVTNGCDPISYGSMAYTVTSDPLKNMNLRPGHVVRDLGVRAFTALGVDPSGEPYVLFDDGQLWIYNADYSSGTYKITNILLDFIDVTNPNEATMGDSTGDSQYIYMPDTNSFFTAGYAGSMMDVTACLPPGGLGDRHYYWQNAGTYILSSRRTVGAHGGNIAGFYIVGTGPGLVNLSAFRALHTSHTNSDPYYTMWCYALEGPPEYAIERYDYYATGGSHSCAFDKTICGSKGDGHNQLNDPKDISGDADDNIYVLDIYSTSQPVVKVYDKDGNYLCEFGDSVSISGTPLRLDVDEGDGEVHVAHTKGVSVFRKCEIPF
jgi:hypothetical protein